MQVPQYLGSIKATLEHKGDVESLRGEMASFREEVNGRIDTLRGEMKGNIKALEVEQKLTREFIKTHSRIMIGIAVVILFLLIKWIFFL